MIGFGRGGGGFDGFPYRSSHQQGQDGRGGGRGGRGRGGGRGRRQQKRQQRGTDGASYHAELEVPPSQRGLIVGRGGATLGRLREETGARIFVPRQRRQQPRQGGDDGDERRAPEQPPADRHDAYPVRVNAAELPDLLHAFHEIRTLLSRDDDADDDASIPCKVKMRTSNGNGRSDNRASIDMRVEGSLTMPPARPHSAGDVSGSLLFRGMAAAPSTDDGAATATGNEDGTAAPPPQQLLAYAIPTELGEADVATAVDNFRFVEASAVDGCRWFYRRPARDANDANDGEGDSEEGTNASRGGLVFVFGAEGSNPQMICRAIEEA